MQLLYSESKKGSTLLYYIVGNRILGYTKRAFANETALNKLLRYRTCMKGLTCLCLIYLPLSLGVIDKSNFTAGYILYIFEIMIQLLTFIFLFFDLTTHTHSVSMTEHVDAVEKAQKNSRITSKACRNQLREIAQLLVYKHLHSAPRDPVACVHRDDGDNEFMNVMANGLTAEVLTVGAEFC